MDTDSDAGLKPELEHGCHTFVELSRWIPDESGKIRMVNEWITVVLQLKYGVVSDNFLIAHRVLFMPLQQQSPSPWQEVGTRRHRTSGKPASSPA